MTINDGLPRSLSELNSRPSRWCIRVPRENEYSPLCLFVGFSAYSNQATRFILDSHVDNETFELTGKLKQTDIMSVQAESWLHCARFIGDMLVLAEVTDPAIFLAVSLVNQCFFVAGCCFAKGELADGQG